MDRKLEDTLRKTGIVAMAIFMVSTIVYIVSDATQSSFRLSETGPSAVFIDRYVSTTKRTELIEGLTDATAGTLARLGIILDPGDQPTAYFVTDRNYGVINAGDHLVSRRLRGVSSSDFMLFRNISLNLYANELIADTITSRDGNYIFMTVEGDWRRSILHGYAHGLATRNIPPKLAAAMDNDAGFDAETWYAFRFVDETMAMFVTDAAEIAADSGGVSSTLEGYGDRVAAAYADPDAPMYLKERIIWLATFNEPPKSSAFYRAASDFSAFLLENLGHEHMISLASRFLTGRYSDLDDLFSELGGLAGSMQEWKGAVDIPRSGLEVPESILDR
ncbi:MAG: hypothetical protein E4H20_02640 [Spirochaetales bacterium]|nr:MAG: hypothetical protein E4H20_02640 [Spirochaetales bacterium]